MNPDDVGSPFLNVVGTDNADTIISFYDNSTITALDGDDTINGTSDRDIIYGGEGDDILYGKNGTDYLDGGAGNDTIYGGSGNDKLYGGYGNDIYVYGRGCGNDYISDSYGINKIVFDNLYASELTVFYPSDTDDAVLTITSTKETLTIKDFRYNQYYRNFTLEFKDGVTGVIDYNSATIIVKEPEEIVQTNAEVLTQIYSDENISSTILSQMDSAELLTDTNSASITDDTDSIADQTDLQVMILTENMSAFADENNVSDGINITDASVDATAMNQLLINSTV